MIWPQAQGCMNMGTADSSFNTNKLADSAAEQGGSARIREQLFRRGGRLTKVQGIVASIAPQLSGASMAVAAGSLLLASGGAFAVTISPTADVDSSTAGTGIKYVAPGPKTTNESGADGIYVQPDT